MSDPPWTLVECKLCGDLFPIDGNDAGLTRALDHKAAHADPEAVVLAMERADGRRVYMVPTAMEHVSPLEWMGPAPKEPPFQWPR